jgi:ssDNA-binding Zn-finger/Zn-ribbon topoisomerase 1
MALHSVNKDQGDPEQNQSDAVQICPICGGNMETVYERNHQKVCVCKDCHSGLTVPASAYEIARIKRESKWMPKP